jgi:23S rRNA G2445 N2-methylase RlmL
MAIHLSGKMDLKAEYEEMSIEELEAVETHFGRADKTTNKVKLEGLYSVLGKYNRLKAIQEKVTLAMDEFKKQTLEALEEQFEGDEPKEVIEKVKKFLAETLAVKKSEEKKNAKVQSLAKAFASRGPIEAYGSGGGVLPKAPAVASAPVVPPINEIMLPPMVPDVPEAEMAEVDSNDVI